MTAALEEEREALEFRESVTRINAIAAETIAKMQPELWRTLRWRPHKTQREILESTSRNQVFAGGRRVGKSQTGGHKLVPYAISTIAEIPWLEALSKRREYWIVGPEYSDSEKEFRVLWDALTRLGFEFDRPGSYNDPHSGDLHLSMWGGFFQVHGKSAKYPQTLVGEGVSGIVCSEAAKLRPSVWPKYLRPTLADFMGWAYFGSTPEGRNWFYRLWEAGQDPTRDDWASWRSPSWDNKHLYPLGASEPAIKALQLLMRDGRIPAEAPPTATSLLREAWPTAARKTWAAVGRSLGIDPEIVSQVVDLSEELFNQEVAALFNEFVGRVFKEFDEEIHVGDFEYDPTWKTYAALDYGFTNPTVWLLIQVDPHNENVRVLSEYYETGRTTEEAAREIQARGLVPGSVLGFYPDPAEPDRSKELSGRLRLRAIGGTGGPLSDRLEWIRRKLKPDPKVAHLDPDHEEWTPQLMIHRSCRNTIREFGSYRYPSTYEEAQAKDKQAPEVPLKKDDHTPEALGRFFAGHYGSPWRSFAPSRQTRARMGRRR
jgi:hypothetical protein